MSSSLSEKLEGEETKTISMAGFDITVAPSPCSKEKSKTAEESIVTESTGTMTDTMTTSNTDLSDVARRIKENNLFIAEKNAQITKIQEDIVEKTIQNEKLLLDLLDFVEFSADKLAMMEQQKAEADAKLQAERLHFAALSDDFTAAFSRLGTFHDRLLSMGNEE